jgi:hypothetical protein
MSRKRSGKLPPFIAMFRHTTKTPAWKASSVGARATFLALKSNYNTHSQNAVFLSARNGAKELGVHKDTARKWLHELEHYGFIVLVRGAQLGIHGTGRAALYRLTDCPYAGDPPTYDFQNWDGVLFESKKQNPVRKNRTPRPKKPDIRADAETPSNGNKCPTEPDIRTDQGCPTEPDITSFTSSLPIPGLVWSAPEVMEIAGAEAAMLLEASKLWNLPPLAQHNERAENFGPKLRSNRPQLVEAACYERSISALV